MGKTLFGVSTAALMVAFAVGWAIPNTQAHIAPAALAQVDTFQLMTGAKHTLRGLFLRILTAPLTSGSSPD